jgi:hypothetical protein
VSDSDSDSPNEGRNRPKTRAALLSYIDEDIDQIQEAMKEKSLRGTLAARKWLVKLRAEFGKEPTREEREAERRMKEPRDDPNPGYSDVIVEDEQVPEEEVNDKSNSTKKKPSRARGKGRKKGKQPRRTMAAIIKAKLAKAKRRKQPVCRMIMISSKILSIWKEKGIF